jgi:response regulator RpfG family c-di-GMP phosphodiesterase
MANVLVVDDEGPLRESMRVVLESGEHQVQTAPDVPSARLLLEGGGVDVVVTDIILPGANGIELTRLVRERFDGVQVILMTGEPSFETASEAVRLGAFDYLAKPMRREPLLRTVGRAAQVKALRDENARLDAELRHQHARLEQQVAERTFQLEEALRGTIEAIARTVERRDPYTAGHQVRVAALGVAIGRELGLPEETMAGLKMAALVHDVGKVAVPADILAKTGVLSLAEFGVVKAHSQAGYEVFQSVALPWPVAPCVLQHHERLDGSGYPAGLKGEAIRLEARIISVADVVEAMASHRPYRPALGVEAALEEIRRNRGRLYDPDAVDACLRCFREKGFRLE